MILSKNDLQCLNFQLPKRVNIFKNLNQEIKIFTVYYSDIVLTLGFHTNTLNLRRNFELFDIFVQPDIDYFVVLHFGCCTGEENGANGRIGREINVSPKL